jgi:DNA repair protein RadC
VQWRRIKGVGKVKAAQLVAAFELARRGLGKGLGTRPVVASPVDALPLLEEIRDQRREHFLCLYLNARNQVIFKEVVSIGSLSASIVHPREVFQAAITHSAASVVLAHNHPSGDVSPSRDDIELTRRLVRAGEIMGIDVLDHIIMAAEDFLSMKERGLM